jgi:hypothetical protein
VPAAGLAGCPQGDAVKPGAEQVGFTDRSSPARQHQEDGLERILGKMAIADELSADAEHHRPVSCHHRGEGSLAGRVTPSDESLKQLAVGEPGGRTHLEE